MKKRGERRKVLTRHPNGQWCRRVEGKLRYFGTDYEEALRRWYRSSRSDLLGLGELARRWLDWKRSKSLSDRTLEFYSYMVVKVMLGLGEKTDPATLSPEQIERWLNTLELGVWKKRHVLVILRSVLNWGEDMGHCELPRGMRLWKGPSDREVRSRRKSEEHLWSCQDIARLCLEGELKGRFMALLGINLGYGMQDMCSSPHVRDGEFVGGPRQKTGIPRLGWLWPETRNLWDELGGLPIAKPRSGHAFRTWKRHVEEMGIDPGPKRHYDLRATLRTLMDPWGDIEVARLVMGHECRTIEKHYLRTISRDRVRTMCRRVRDQIMQHSEQHRCPSSVLRPFPAVQDATRTPSSDC